MTLRFNFGKNWSSYSRKALTPERIERARLDFSALCSDIDFSGKTFLDIGFGQGLALFFAAEKGAKVYGIDIDPDCQQALQATAKFFPNIQVSEIMTGSIIDQQTAANLKKIGPFDIVHSWGVLHHTGNLKLAIQNTATLVKNNGFLVLAIYQSHWSSPLWWIAKLTYNVLPAAGQKAMALLFYLPLYAATMVLTRKNPNDLPRGMNFYNDLVDWIGGYPYEPASSKEVRAELEGHFRCLKEVPAVVPTGNIQYVFKKFKE